MKRPAPVPCNVQRRPQWWILLEVAMRLGLLR